MLKIGITGGLGSGKTIVCEVFKLLKIPVYNADEEAKEIINTHQHIALQLKETFGNEIYAKNNILDRKKLAEIVFNNPQKLQELNNIVHPEVKKHFQHWANGQKEAPYIIKEAAILFESESYKDLDVIITVYAPKKLRIERVMKRDKCSAESAEARMNQQMSDEDKIKRSHHVINNDDTELIIPQILKLHELFISNSAFV